MGTKKSLIIISGFSVIILGSFLIGFTIFSNENSLYYKEQIQTNTNKFNSKLVVDENHSYDLRIFTKINETNISKTINFTVYLHFEGLNKTIVNDTNSINVDSQKDRLLLSEITFDTVNYDHEIEVNFSIMFNTDSVNLETIQIVIYKDRPKYNLILGIIGIICILIGLIVMFWPIVYLKK